VVSRRPMTRKARALLNEARVTVRSLGSDHLCADVMCPAAGRTVVEFEDGRWSCTCPHGGGCVHMQAVAAICDLPRPPLSESVLRAI